MEAIWYSLNNQISDYMKQQRYLKKNKQIKPDIFFIFI